MNIRRLSGLLKELKRIFRRRRKLGLNFAFLFVAAATMMLAQSSDDPSKDSMRNPSIAVWSSQPQHAEIRESLMVFLQEHDVERSVEVITFYVCGEEQQTFGRLTSAEILELMEQHPAWIVDSSDSEQIIFYEYVDDLSERCKQSAYIGIDAMDQLTLFEGSPNQDNAIRTFFQIDIEYLKTSLPPEAIDSLYNGIRIRDLAQYNSVISTFSQFAVGGADQAAGAIESEMNDAHKNTY